jgi:hypothetical protein
VDSLKSMLSKTLSILLRTMCWPKQRINANEDFVRGDLGN